MSETNPAQSGDTSVPSTNAPIPGSARVPEGETTYSIYFWTAEVSPHLLPVFDELRARPRVRKAVYVASGELGEVRRNLGWSVDVADGEDFVLGPDASRIDALVRESDPDSVHVFAGIRWYPAIVAGLAAVRRHGRRFGVLSEPRVLEGVKGLARLLQSWATEGFVRRRADFVLAIGAHGPAWFRLAGYGRRKIFPFAYFLPNPRRTIAATRTPGDAPVVAFLGRLERLKGFHLFLEALPHLRHAVRVEVAGSGSLASEAAARSDHGGSFVFHGALPIAKVPEFLGAIDILVLPSITKDDGWGAVVSEALMAGAAVVASERVGASMCLTDPVRGEIVCDLTGAGVARAVDALIDRGILDDAGRRKRAEWAARHLDRAAGADHFLRILDSIYVGRPRPPSFVD